jgi:hypothetical protein
MRIGRELVCVELELVCIGWEHMCVKWELVCDEWELVRIEWEIVCVEWEFVREETRLVRGGFGCRIIDMFRMRIGKCRMLSPKGAKTAVIKRKIKKKCGSAGEGFFRMRKGGVEGGFLVGKVGKAGGVKKSGFG